MEPAACYQAHGAEPAIKAAPVERHGLTDRELEVLGLVCQALPDKAIARLLGISVKTVGTYLEHVYLKLGIHSDSQNARCAAILAALGLGLVMLPSCH